MHVCIFPFAGTSLKWAEDVNREAGKAALGLADQGCTWKEGLLSAAHLELLSFPSGGSLQTALMTTKDVNVEVLKSGVACLPGEECVKVPSGYCGCFYQGTEIWCPLGGGERQQVK